MHVICRASCKLPGCLGGVCPGLHPSHGTITPGLIAKWLAVWIEDRLYRVPHVMLSFVGPIADSMAAAASSLGSQERPRATPFCGGSEFLVEVAPRGTDAAPALDIAAASMQQAGIAGSVGPWLAHSALLIPLPFCRQ